MPTVSSARATSTNGPAQLLQYSTTTNGGFAGCVASQVKMPSRACLDRRFRLFDLAFCRYT